MYIWKSLPAVYIFGENEQRAANITLVDCRTFGAVGRLYLGGKESDIAASEAAESATSMYTARKKSKSHGGERLQTDYRGRRGTVSYIAFSF